MVHGTSRRACVRLTARGCGGIYSTGEGGGARGVGADRRRRRGRMSNSRSTVEGGVEAGEAGTEGGVSREGMSEGTGERTWTPRRTRNNGTGVVEPRPASKV